MAEKTRDENHLYNKKTHDNRDGQQKEKRKKMRFFRHQKDPRWWPKNYYTILLVSGDPSKFQHFISLFVFFGYLHNWQVGGLYFFLESDESLLTLTFFDTSIFPCSCFCTKTWIPSLDNQNPFLKFTQSCRNSPGISFFLLLERFSIHRSLSFPLKQRIRDIHRARESRCRGNLLYLISLSCLRFGFFWVSDLLVDCGRNRQKWGGGRPNSGAQCGGGCRVGSLGFLGLFWLELWSCLFSIIGIRIDLNRWYRYEDGIFIVISTDVILIEYVLGLFGLWRLIGSWFDWYISLLIKPMNIWK